MAVKVAGTQGPPTRGLASGSRREASAEPLLRLCVYLMYMYLCACVHMQVCRCADVQVYVLILTLHLVWDRVPLWFTHCICQARRSMSFQGFPLLCLPNGHWIRKMIRWCYSVHLQMALGSQTQVCLTHWAIPKSYPTFSYHLKSSNWGWEYSSKMFEHFYLKFFIPGTWDQLTRLPAWKHHCILLSDSI